MSSPLPAIFFGHGSPMNAMERNFYTEAWSAMGAALPRPRVVLMMSAHWYVPGVKVTAMAQPRTIHDFTGFPPNLRAFHYPAHGDPEFAEHIIRMLRPVAVSPDHLWGLDHGAWSVLCHIYPHAKVPVVQLSIDSRQPPAFHYELGRRLTSLRDDGVLIMGSGNIVHNLAAVKWSEPDAKPYDWAVRFESRIRTAIEAGDHQTVTGYELLGEDAALSAPTPEHFLPLLYTLGAAREGEKVSFPVEGMDLGSISMLSVQMG